MNAGANLAIFGLNRQVGQFSATSRGRQSESTPHGEYSWFPRWILLSIAGNALERLENGLDAHDKDIQTLALQGTSRPAGDLATLAKKYRDRRDAMDEPLSRVPAALALADARLLARKDKLLKDAEVLKDIFLISLAPFSSDLFDQYIEARQEDIARLDATSQRLLAALLVNEYVPPPPQQPQTLGRRSRQLAANLTNDIEREQFIRDRLEAQQWSMHAIEALASVLPGSGFLMDVYAIATGESWTGRRLSTSEQLLSGAIAGASLLFGTLAARSMYQSTVDVAGSVRRIDNGLDGARTTCQEVRLANRTSAAHNRLRRSVGCGCFTSDTLVQTWVPVGGMDGWLTGATVAIVAGGVVLTVNELEQRRRLKAEARPGSPWKIAGPPEENDHLWQIPEDSLPGGSSDGDLDVLCDLLFNGGAPLNSADDTGKHREFDSPSPGPERRTPSASATSQGTLLNFTPVATETPLAIENPPVRIDTTVLPDQEPRMAVATEPKPGRIKPPVRNRTGRWNWLLILLGTLGVWGLCIAGHLQNPQFEQSTRRISEITLGDNVPGANPGETDDLSFGRSIDPEAWRWITVTGQKSNGTFVEIEVLRPLAWLESCNAERGSTIPLEFHGLGLPGPVRVTDIQPCPPIRPGPGQTVTGIYRHYAPVILDLKTANGEQIGVTPDHRFWSEDRQEFIQAADLQAGETLRLLNGTTTVESIKKRTSGEPVTTLEVHVEHVFHVAQSGVLVHNCPTGIGAAPNTGTGTYSQVRGHHVHAKAAFKAIARARASASARST